MDVKKPRFILDSFALLAFFQGEPGGEQVRDILSKAQHGRVQVFFSVINLGEIYYIVARKEGQHKARDIINDISRLPLEMVDAGTDRVLAAAEIKAHYPISYADAFVAAVAIEFYAVIVTGDPEFKSMASKISIIWI